MSSGKRHYFRHSFFATEDAKIQRVIEDMGFEGYGFYFSLLELCGRQCAEETKNPITFHIQTVRKVWRKNTESTKKVLRKLEESGLFLVTFSEHSVSLDIPSFGKYLGRYDSNSPKKSKEKESKEKEIYKGEKPAPQAASRPPLFEVEQPQLETIERIPEKASKVLTALNAILNTGFRPTKSTLSKINARLKEGFVYEDFTEVFKWKLKQWGNDSAMRPYLRPETLLGTKFDSYLQEARKGDEMTESEADQLIAKYWPGA